VALMQRQQLVWVYVCERCGHEWIPRDCGPGWDPNEREAPPPKVCASCKSPYWDRPRRVPKSA
jgi:hypothetical protein